MGVKAHVYNVKMGKGPKGVRRGTEMSHPLHFMGCPEVKQESAWKLVGAGPQGFIMTVCHHHCSGPQPGG